MGCGRGTLRVWGSDAWKTRVLSCRDEVTVCSLKAGCTKALQKFSSHGCYEHIDTQLLLCYGHQLGKGSVMPFPIWDQSWVYMVSELLELHETLYFLLLLQKTVYTCCHGCKRTRNLPKAEIPDLKTRLTKVSLGHHLLNGFHEIHSHLIPKL